MRDEAPPPRPPDGGPRSPAAFRRSGTLSGRLRVALRRIVKRVLGAELVWGLAFVGGMLVLLESRHWGVGYETFVPGEAVPYNVTAVQDFEVRDEALTHERRSSASDRVPSVYVFDTQRGVRLAAEIASLFEAGRNAAVESGRGPTESGVWQDLRRRLGPEALEVLTRHGFSGAIEERMIQRVEAVHRWPIVANRALLDRERAVLLTRTPGNREELISEYAAILDLDAARERVRVDARRDSLLPAEDRETIGELSAAFVDPNLVFDARGTAERRAAAAESVPPVLLRVPQGTVLARAGDRFTPESLALIGAARAAALRRLGIGEFLGALAVLGMLSFFLWRYSHYHQRRFRKIEHLHALLVLVLLLSMLAAQGTLWVSRALVDDLAEPFHHAGYYVYLVPMGAGSILVALLANGRIAIVYSAFASILFGGLVGWDALAIVWSFLVQMASVYAISTYRERAALLRAGFVVGSAGSLAAVAVEGLRDGSGTPGGALFAAGLAFAGGAVGVGLLVSFALPVFERLFNVLTDIRLLELSNGSHPLLAELALKAPGSYNHSLVVGTLAQDAANAVGANSLFCRVAALYHDVGKIQKPEYYVENQRGKNPHDQLSPTMSALVIAAHVKDGVRIARDAGVPEPIVDIIPQHHGTRLMTFFLEKARRGMDPSLGGVREDDFRYPGPRPRTAEAAIFMLADAVEAAARTVDEPTPNRLRELIRRVTSAVVLDRQLDECELTFADLERIQESFLRTLLGMHHHRLQYPGFEFGKARGAPRADVGPVDRRPERAG